jgi:hypothetical protein
VVALKNSDNQLTDAEKRTALDKAEAIFSQEENVKSKLDKLNPKNRQEILDEFKNLKQRDQDLDPSIRRENYQRNHEFLTQQIDERSHQVWILGSLFVPISFLIFTYVVVNPKTPPADQFLLMLGSLTCYLAFYHMYRRITLLNDSSYPCLHALELALGLYAHLKLGEFWNKYKLLQRRVLIFTGALYVLAAIWGFHLALVLNTFSVLLVPVVLVMIFHEYIRVGVRRVSSRSRRRTLALIVAGVGTLLAATVLWSIPAPPLMDGVLSISPGLDFSYWWIAVLFVIVLGVIFVVEVVVGRKKEKFPETPDTPHPNQGPIVQSNTGNQQPSMNGATTETSTQAQTKRRRLPTARLAQSSDSSN